MKVQKIFSLLFVAGLVFSGTLHSDSLPEEELTLSELKISEAALPLEYRSVTIGDAFSKFWTCIKTLYSFCTSFDEAEKEFLQRNGAFPIILCGKCNIQKLNSGYLAGTFIAQCFKRFDEKPNTPAKALNNFDTLTSLINELSKLVNEGSFSDVEDFMIRTANEIKHDCRKCNAPSDSWGKIA